MFGRKRLLLLTLGALFIAGTAAAIVIATGDDADETPITGDALAKASAAALAHTGGGTVTGTEVGDEEGYYEVEVTLNDGTEVDVHLDEAFNVIGSAADEEDDHEDLHK